MARNLVVVACLSFVVVVTTNASVTLSFQHQPQPIVSSSPATRLSSLGKNWKRDSFSLCSSSRLEATKISEPESRTTTTTSPRQQHNSNAHNRDSNVPYGEANYDPLAADEFYEARPMKSLGRFLQIAGKSSKFVLDTTIFDDKDTNNNDGRMTEGERKKARELVNLITALGPAFIKFGQALSTRTDLLPTDKAYYATGLEELQDAVEPSFDFEEAKSIIVDELGISNIDEVFESLTSQPVASASIGQVYKGKLRSNGMEVAVKVQRPNVLENVALDLYVMRSILAPLWNKFINSRGDKNDATSTSTTSTTTTDINKSNTDSIALVDAWGEGFVNELDYRAEANATKEFTKAMEERGLGSVVFAPTVIEELSSTHVLTTQWVEGERLSESDEEDVPRLCGVALNAYLTMLLDTGTLHCDPHPGNLLRTPDGKLCILDWGMVLEVPNDLQLSLLEFIANLNAKNYEDVPKDLVKLRFVPPDKLEDLRKSGMTVGIATMLNLAAEGGGPKGAMKRMVAQNKEKYAEALKDFDDLDSEEATKVRQKLFREDWNRKMAEDSLSRENGGAATAVTSTTVDLTTKIESMRQQNTDVFAIPDYFVYMSRAFATLEGIGLSSNENYSILQECYPYLAKRLLSDDSQRARDALKTLLYGSKDGKELDLTKLRELSDGLETYTTSTSSVESGRSSSSSDNIESSNNEGRNAAIEQVASVVLSEDSNFVQEVLLRETALALDATVRDTVQSPLKPILRNLPLAAPLDGGTAFATTSPPAFLRPFTLPLMLTKASLDLQSIDAVDERRLENVRILTKLASGSSSSSNNNKSTNQRTPAATTETIGKVAREAAKRRLALARIGVRFGGTMTSIQAERLRERATMFAGEDNGQYDKSVAEFAKILALNGADRLEAVSEAIRSLDDQLGKQRATK